MTSEDFDFSKICRVCCATDSTTMTLFKVHISKKLMSCASVQVIFFLVFHFSDLFIPIFLNLGLAK